MGVKFQPRVGPFVYRRSSGMGPITGLIYGGMMLSLWLLRAFVVLTYLLIKITCWDLPLWIYRQVQAIRIQRALRAYEPEHKQQV